MVVLHSFGLGSPAGGPELMSHQEVDLVDDFAFEAQPAHYAASETGACLVVVGEVPVAFGVL